MISRRSRPKEILFSAVLVVASLVVAIVAAEMFLRIQEPYLRLMKDKAEWALDKYQIHPVWHHWLRPNQVMARPTHDPSLFPQPIIYRTNAVGCRDDDPPRKRRGTYRILVLGDSFTEGYYADQTVAGVLEKQLNQIGDRSYDVVNCGTTSYSPLLHYLRYRHQLHELEPDEVIVNIDLTDVYDDNWRYAPQTTFSESGEPLYAREPRDRLTNVIDALRFRFYLARLIMGTPTPQINMPLSQNVFAYHRGLPVESERWQKDVGFSIDLIHRLIDLIQQSGASVTISMYPYRQQFEPVHGEPLWNRSVEERIAEAAATAGAEFYSAYDDLRPLYDAGVSLYWANDLHFNPVGQSLWAKAFTEWYMQRRTQS